MPVTVVGDLRIAELDRFLAVFADQGLAKRAEHGCVGTTVLSPTGDSGRVLVLLEFEDVAHFEAFRDDPTAPPIMREGGAQGPPQFTVTEVVGTFSH